MNTENSVFYLAIYDPFDLQWCTTSCTIDANIFDLFFVRVGVSPTATVNSLFNVGLGESEMTTLKQKTPVSANSLDLSEKEGSVGFCCPRPQCLT